MVVQMPIERQAKVGGKKKKEKEGLNRLVETEVVENGRKAEEEENEETTVRGERVGHNKCEHLTTVKKSELIICVWFGISHSLTYSLSLYFSFPLLSFCICDCLLPIPVMQVSNVVFFALKFIFVFIFVLALSSHSQLSFVFLSSICMCSYVC